METVPIPRWQDAALCAQTDPDRWFPEDGVNPKAARRICRSCPVQAECLDFALAVAPEHGIWAGRSARQLRAMRREGTVAA
jgi:WhiB family transcriptional regulator, redox-sensing transcriptional regulator